MSRKKIKKQSIDELLSLGRSSERSERSDRSEQTEQTEPKERKPARKRREPVPRSPEPVEPELDLEQPPKPKKARKRQNKSSGGLTVRRVFNCSDDTAEQIQLANMQAKKFMRQRGHDKAVPESRFLLACVLTALQDLEQYGANSDVLDELWDILQE